MRVSTFILILLLNTLCYEAAHGESLTVVFDHKSSSSVCALISDDVTCGAIQVEKVLRTAELNGIYTVEACSLISEEVTCRASDTIELLSLVRDTKRFDAEISANPHISSDEEK